MNEQELEKRITEANEQMIALEPEEEPVAEIPATDLWQNRRKAIREMKPRTVRGASPKMQLDLAGLLDGPIKDAYKKTRDDCDLLRAEGETERARLLEQQYMEDYYYPVIDALVRLNSRDRVLASQDALEALDALAMVPGGGSTNGYASVFISSLYEPLEGIVQSDSQVRSAVQQITELCNRGQVRQASTMAQRMQDKIDRGDNIATPEDYEILQRIVLRTS